MLHAYALANSFQRHVVVRRKKVRSLDTHVWIAGVRGSPQSQGHVLADMRTLKS
jgi:hypothetical protein